MGTFIDWILTILFLLVWFGGGTWLVKKILESKDKQVYIGSITGIKVTYEKGFYGGMDLKKYDEAIKKGITPSPQDPDYWKEIPEGAKVEYPDK